MTNEIDKQFFDTFGIGPRLVISLEDWERCKDLPRAEELFKHYPQITDHILLELICIHNTYLGDNLYSLDYESLKKEVLKDLINEQELRELKKDYVSYDMKHQVRILFDEG